MINKNGDEAVLNKLNNSNEDELSKEGKNSRESRFSNKSKFPKEKDTGINILSARETEVLKLLSEGCTNKETAKRLSISVRTVETHRKNIMEKIKVKNLAGLIKFSIAHKLIKI